MSALPRIATTERTCQHVSNVPDSDMSNAIRIFTREGDDVQIVVRIVHNYRDTRPTSGV
jgi:hypothetical protein